jgi:ABC-type antimicrobial peptide transport system permease subunit
VALTLAGLSIGLPIAFASSIVLNSVMWGFTRFDPLVFTAAPALLVLAALAASYVPARRAMRMEPIAVLRHD